MNVLDIVCIYCLCVYMLIFVEDVNWDFMGDKGFFDILIFLKKVFFLNFRNKI